MSQQDDLGPLIERIGDYLCNHANGERVARSILVLLGVDPEFEPGDEVTGEDALAYDEAIDPTTASAIPEKNLEAREVAGTTPGNTLPDVIENIRYALLSMPQDYGISMARAVLTDLTTRGGRRRRPVTDDEIVADILRTAPRPSSLYHSTDLIAEYMAKRGMGYIEAAEIENFMMKDPTSFDFRLMVFAGRLYEFVYLLDKVANEPVLAEHPELTPQTFAEYRRELMGDITEYFNIMDSFYERVRLHFEQEDRNPPQLGNDSASEDE